MILHGIEYQRPTSLNMRILADHVTYSFLAFMKSIFHFCLGCYCGGYSQNGRSNLSSWGRETHICVGKLTIIASDNGLSPGRRQAIIWTNAGILLIGPLGTNFNEILIAIHTFSFKKMHLKMSSAKWRPFCLGLNELMCLGASLVRRSWYWFCYKWGNRQTSMNNWECLTNWSLSFKHFNFYGHFILSDQRAYQIYWRVYKLSTRYISMYMWYTGIWIISKFMFIPPWQKITG